MNLNYDRMLFIPLGYSSPSPLLRNWHPTQKHTFTLGSLLSRVLDYKCNACTTFGDMDSFE